MLNFTYIHFNGKKLRLNPNDFEVFFWVPLPHKMYPCASGFKSIVRPFPSIYFPSALSFLFLWFQFLIKSLSCHSILINWSLFLYILRLSITHLQNILPWTLFLACYLFVQELQSCWHTYFSRSFTYSFIWKIFTQCLSSTKHSSRHWGKKNSEQNRQKKSLLSQSLCLVMRI